MATTISKQRVLSTLLSAAVEVGDTGADRPVLEQVIYGFCRSDATPEQADRAFRNLKDRFFDWNEVRVSSTRELEDALVGLTNSEGRAVRIIALLQEVFETTFSFDLDGLLKKGLKQAAKQVGRYQAADDFAEAWLGQRSFEGQGIPVDAATLRVTRRLHLVGERDDVPAARVTLEALVPQAKAAAFTDAVSNVAEDHCFEADPSCPTCPLNGDCPTAQGGASRPARVRPR